MATYTLRVRTSSPQPQTFAERILAIVDCRNRQEHVSRPAKRQIPWVSWVSGVRIVESHQKHGVGAGQDFED